MDPEENPAPEHELQFGGYDFVFVDEPSSEQFCSVCLFVMKNAAINKSLIRQMFRCIINHLRGIRKRNIEKKLYTL